MMVAPVWMTSDPVSVHHPGDVGSAVPDKSGDLFQGHAGVGQQRDERVPQLARRPVSRVEPGTRRRARCRSRRTFAASMPVPRLVAKTRPVSPGLGMGANAGS